jgi:hypothetical protein
MPNHPRPTKYIHLMARPPKVGAYGDLTVGTSLRP